MGNAPENREADPAPGLILFGVVILALAYGVSTGNWATLATALLVGIGSLMLIVGLYKLAPGRKR